MSRIDLYGFGRICAGLDDEQVRVRVKVLGALENHGTDAAAPRGTEAHDELRATGAARRNGRRRTGPIWPLQVICERRNNDE